MIYKLSEAQTSLILEEVSSGSSITHAARAAQTSSARIAKIIAVAKEAEGKVLEGEVSQDQLEHWELWAIEFYVALQVAMGLLERKLVDRVLGASEGPKADWKAAAWMLERLWPERWAKQPATKGSVTNNGVMLLGGGAGMQSSESLLEEAKRIALAAAKGALESGDPEVFTSSPVIEIEEIFDPPMKEEIAVATERDADEPELNDSLYDTADF